MLCQVDITEDVRYHFGCNSDERVKRDIAVEVLSGIYEAVEHMAVPSDVGCSVITNRDTLCSIFRNKLKPKNFSGELENPAILSPCLNIEGNKYDLVRNKKVMCDRSSFCEGCCLPPLPYADSCIEFGGLVGR